MQNAVGGTARAAAVKGSFFICGPTATGKTDAAIEVANACNGEIVNADAFQVYRGLDLLTAKPSHEAQAQVPHHLVGTVALRESFNVALYLEAALEAITGILQRGRLPVVVGGTGLYIRALTRGLAEIPPSSPEIRAELEGTPLPALTAQLEKLDPEAFRVIDLKNPRRVLRALEVILLTGKPFSSFREEWAESPPFTGVLLDWNREELYARINRRTETMFAQGVVDEVRAVRDSSEGAPVLSDTASQVIGWRPIEALLQGTLTEAECVAQIQASTRHYAKRQLTWFRREPMLTPIPLTRQGHAAGMEAIIRIAKEMGQESR